MITLYKQIETKGLYYKEMWYENADKVLIEHSGKVGYVGTIAKTSMTEKEAAIRLQDFFIRIYNRLLLNILYVINQKYGLNL